MLQPHCEGPPPVQSVHPRRTSYRPEVQITPKLDTNSAPRPSSSAKLRTVPDKSNPLALPNLTRMRKGLSTGALQGAGRSTEGRPHLP